MARGRNRGAGPGGDELDRKTGDAYVVNKSDNFWAGEINEEGGADFDVSFAVLGWSACEGRT
jgi:hypothetical protein